MTSIELDVAQPVEYEPPTSSTVAPSILRKVQMEITPTNQVEYSPTGTDTITFVVNNSNAFLLGSESYFRFDIQRLHTGTDPYAGFISADLPGGIHPFIKKIEVRSMSTGILLQSIERYNLITSMMFLLSGEEPALKMISGPIEGFSKDFERNAYHSTRGCVSYSAASDFTMAASSTTVTITLPSVAAHQIAKVGDTVVVHDGTATETRLITAVADNTFTVNFALTITVPTYIHIIPQNRTLPERRYLMSNSATTSDTSVTQTVIFQPVMALLSHDLPMFLLSNGISITFELEQADRAMHTMIRPSLATQSFDYEIRNPRYMAMFSTPTREIQNKWISLWNGPGITYYIPTTRTRLLDGNSNDQNTNLSTQMGVRSARRIWTVVLSNTISTSTGALTRVNRSLSSFFRSDISLYQYQSGSNLYPQNEVDCDTEVREHCNYFFTSTQGAFQRGLPVMDEQKARSQDLYWNSTSDTSMDTDSLSFVMAAQLDRTILHNGQLTGIDLSLVPIQLKIERTQSWSAGNHPGNPTYLMIVGHDSFVQFKSSQILVML